MVNFASQDPLVETRHVRRNLLMKLSHACPAPGLLSVVMYSKISLSRLSETELLMNLLSMWSYEKEEGNTWTSFNSS